VYDNGYEGKDRKDYEAGLEYEKLKYFSKYLTARTNQGWIDQVLDDKEVTTELCVPVPSYKLSELFENNMIIKTENNDRDPMVLVGCRYGKEVGLDLNDRFTSLIGHI
jgi:membrane-bound lytic murein transglycosylase MltF